jgi:hypothetical protein
MLVYLFRLDSKEIGFFFYDTVFVNSKYLADWNTKIYTDIATLLHSSTNNAILFDLISLLHWCLVLLLLIFLLALVTTRLSISSLASMPLRLFFSLVVSLCRPIIRYLYIIYIVIMIFYSENYNRSLDQSIIKSLSIICVKLFLSLFCLLTILLWYNLIPWFGS